MLFPLHYILCHHRHHHKTKLVLKKNYLATVQRSKIICVTSAMQREWFSLSGNYIQLIIIIMSHVMTITMCAQQCMGRRMNCMHFKNFKAYYDDTGCLKSTPNVRACFFGWMLCCREPSNKNILRNIISKSQWELHSHRCCLC